MWQLETVNLEELISYSKLKESPTITIIDNLPKDEFDYLMTIVKRLELIVFLIKDSKMVAFIYHSYIAQKIGLELKKKIQVIYYDYAKRPKGSIVIAAMSDGRYCDWIVTRDNGYIVEAYNEQGEKIEEFINTNIDEAPCENLLKYGFKNYSFSLNIKGYGNSGRSNDAILELSRKHYVNNGVFNEMRQCYYPSDTTTNKGIAEYNKLEKLFRKWGFKSL